MDEELLKQGKLSIYIRVVFTFPNSTSHFILTDVIPLSTKPVVKKFQHPVKSTEERKQEKENRQKRRGRIIVRNISYKSTEAKLREHFSNFGVVQEVNVLKRSDGRLVGCAFVQFEKVNEAAKAILKSNGKDFLGRTVHCDWAVNKDQYSKHVKKNRKGSNTIPTVVVNEEDVDDVSIKSELDSEADGREEGTDVGGSGEEDEGSDHDDNNDKKDIKLGIKTDPDEKDNDEKKPRKFASDLEEGCTVFIKNIPFDASDHDFKKCCLQFGHIYYALLNKDPVSGHAKGTGFVKYRVCVN